MCMIFSQCNTCTIGYIPYGTTSRGVLPATNIYLGKLLANGSVLMTVRYASGRRTTANIMITVPTASHVP